MTEPVVIGSARLYLGDCLDVLPMLGQIDALVTDPPYPNLAGHFMDSIETAKTLLVRGGWSEAIVFWTELEAPPATLPLVAVHVWHRTNVNGRPYEPAFHFCADGVKQRSDVYGHAMIHSGVGPGSSEYDGHPTQKPVAIMERLVAKTGGIVLDPFMGSGSTGVACARLRRPFVGIEIDPAHFETAVRRIGEAQRQPNLFPPEALGQMEQGSLL